MRTARPSEATASAIDIDTAPRWLLTSEAAAWARVTDRTLRTWARLGYIKVRKPAGGRVLIDRDSLRTFIEGAAA